MPGRSASSASRTSTASGRPSRARSVSTSPIRRRHGATTSRGCKEHADALTERGFDAMHLRGPGTDLRLGLPAGAHLGVRRGEDGLGPSVRPEHADRGGVHDAARGARPRASSGRRSRSSCSASSSATSRCASRAGARSRSARPRARTCCARTWRPTPTRRASASSRWSTTTHASAGPGSPSTTRSSTRTPRRTSRTARASRRRSPAAAT